MKLMDEKHRLFGILNPFDCLVVLIAILVLLSALFFRRPAKVKEREELETDRDVYFQVVVRELADFMSNNLEVGDKVYTDDARAGCVGEIIDIKRTIGTAVIALFDGELVYADHPDTYNLLITVKGEAALQDNIFQINGVYPMALGANRSYHTTYVNFTGQAVYLDTKEPDLDKPFDLDHTHIEGMALDQLKGNADPEEAEAPQP